MHLANPVQLQGLSKFFGAILHENARPRTVTRYIGSHHRDGRINHEELHFTHRCLVRFFISSPSLYRHELVPERRKVSTKKMLVQTCGTS